jgi:hypothetical protein
MFFVFVQVLMMLEFITFGIKISVIFEELDFHFEREIVEI